MLKSWVFILWLCSMHCWTGHSALQSTVSLPGMHCNALSPFRDCGSPSNQPNSSEFFIACSFSLISCCVLKSLIPRVEQWPYLLLPPLKEKFVQCLFKEIFFIIDELISKYFHCCIRSICFWKMKLSLNSSFLVG